MLKPQEIRMSIYYSLFYEKIVSELNLNSAWRRFLGKCDLFAGGKKSAHRQIP